MKLVYWPREEGADAEIHEIATLEDLWGFVSERRYLIDECIFEITANEEEDGSPYLILSWREVEE